MSNGLVKILGVSAIALSFGTMSAEAANCQGRRDTGTAVGAIGGGLIGNQASGGNTGGTIAGAILGGVAGNVIGGSNCSERSHKQRVYHDRRGRAYYMDSHGRRHYYR